MNILIIDNFDSFVYNIKQYLEEEGAKVTVWRNNAIDWDHIYDFSGIVLSPGPGIPSEAGELMEVISEMLPRKPILGICLGLQALGEAFGGKLKNLSEPVHGIATSIKILDIEDPIFNGFKYREYDFGRYHSWVIDNQSINDKFRVLMRSEDGEIMAIRHIKKKVYGFQFHPESILSEPHGRSLFQNWLSIIHPSFKPKHQHLQEISPIGQPISSINNSTTKKPWWKFWN